MKKILLNLAVCCALFVSSTTAANADLITGWDFTNGTAATTAPSPLVYNAAVGTGKLYLDGTSGSSTWLTPMSNPQVTGFGGTAVNTTPGDGLSTTTSGQSSLALANQTANGKSIVFAFSMAGFKDLVVSYASQRTATGFTTQAWEYSNDGASWTSFDSKAPATAFATTGILTLGTVTALNNDATSFLRLTLTGASSATGNNRLDNIKLSGTVSAVPEPASMLLASIAGITGGYGAWRRRNAKKA